MAVPRTKTAVRTLLAAHGLDARRSRGQHFLVDGNLVDAIVRTAGVGPDDCVLEVGTGTGILTDALAERGARVVSCDVDGRLQTVTRSLRPWPSDVRFVEADVLAGKRSLNPVVTAAWQDAATGRRPRIVSNLPYAIATPFLASLLWEGVPFADAHLLVQLEAAQRFVAAPGSREYGPVSVAVGLLARAGIVRRVGPQVFWPEPKVQSALLRVEPVDCARARVLAEQGLPGLLHEAFLHRRKTLRKRFGESDLAQAGIDPGARPDQVAPAQWVRLLTAWRG